MNFRWIPVFCLFLISHHDNDKDYTKVSYFIHPFDFINLLRSVFFTLDVIFDFLFVNYNSILLSCEELPHFFYYYFVFLSFNCFVCSVSCVVSVVVESFSSTLVRLTNFSKLHMWRASCVSGSPKNNIKFWDKFILKEVLGKG